MHEACFRQGSYERFDSARPFGRLTFRREMEQLDLHALSMSILVLDVSNKFLPLVKTCAPFVRGVYVHTIVYT